MMSVSFPFRKEDPIMQPASRLIHLPEIAVTDWLNKLGEPAFVAWLRLRTWRDHNELKIPIRQIIQKLGVANKTFYAKILTPHFNRFTARSKRVIDGDTLIIFLNEKEYTVRLLLNRHTGNP
jgi:hypothetical protein